MIRSKRLAACSLVASLCVVVMLLGALLELGIYAAPLICAVALLPIGQKYGTKYQLLVWAAVSLLSFILVPNPEQNLLFFGIFGWYPIARPALQRFPRMLRIVFKLALFNAVVIAVEALVMLVLVPEMMGAELMILFLVLMNILLLCFDRLLPLAEILMARLTKYI